MVMSEEEVITMPNIRPISDLRNFSDVVRDVTVGEPVFLTKNGRGRYVLLDIKEYEKTKATIRLLSELAEAETAGKSQGWLSTEEVKGNLRV